MKHFVRVGLMTGLAIGSLTTVASAQGNPPPPPQPQQMPMGRMGMGGMGGMGGMRGRGRMGGPQMGPRGRTGGPGRMGRMVPAARLLGAREELQLTDDQVKRLEALRTSQREALRPPTPARLRAEADLAEARDKDNIDAERAALEKLAKLRVDQEVAFLKAAKDARDVLTPDQREKIGLRADRRP